MKPLRQKSLCPAAHGKDFHGSVLQSLESWLRRGLLSLVWKQWKHRRKRFRRFANGAWVRTSQRKPLVVLTARSGSRIHLLLPLHCLTLLAALGLPLWWCGLLPLNAGQRDDALPYADSCGFAASPIAFIVGPHGVGN